MRTFLNSNDEPVALCVCCATSQWLAWALPQSVPPVSMGHVHTCRRCRQRCDNLGCDHLRPDMDGTMGDKPWTRWKRAPLTRLLRR